MNFFNLRSLILPGDPILHIICIDQLTIERHQIEEVHFSGRAILIKYHFFLLKIYNNQLESGHLYPIFGFWKSLNISNPRRAHDIESLNSNSQLQAH